MQTDEQSNERDLIRRFAYGSASVTMLSPCLTTPCRALRTPFLTQQNLLFRAADSVMLIYSFTYLIPHFPLGSPKGVINDTHLPLAGFPLCCSGALVVF